MLENEEVCAKLRWKQKIIFLPLFYNTFSFRNAIKQGNMARIEEALDSEGVNPNSRVSSLFVVNILCNDISVIVVQRYYKPHTIDPGSRNGQSRYCYIATFSSSHWSKPKCKSLNFFSFLIIHLFGGYWWIYSPYICCIQGLKGYCQNFTFCSSNWFES